MTPLGLMDIGFSEMLVVGLVALLVFGGRLPEMMRHLGRAYANFRRSMDEISHPIREEFRRIDRESQEAARLSRRPLRAAPPPDASPVKPLYAAPDTQPVPVEGEARDAPADAAEPSPPPPTEPTGPAPAASPPSPEPPARPAGRRARHPRGAADEPPPV